MASNRFSVTVIFLTVIISITGAIFFWSLSQDYLSVTKFSAGVIWIVLILILIYFVNRTNRSLSAFLETVGSLDSSKPLVGKDDDSFKLLNLTYNEILDSIQHVKISKETDYKYFQSMADNSGSGIICYKENGDVDFINRAAREIFRIESHGRIEGIDKHAEGFSDLCKNMSTSTNELYRMVINGELKSMLTRKSILKKGTDILSLITVQNIHGILEEEEIQVWQKLINVLTHEIMNSVSPIKSLSGTLTRKLKSGKISESENNSELIEGLEAIDKRSKGLMQFVESYQELTKIPEPVFQKVKLRTLINDVINILSGNLEEKRITINIVLENENCQINIDDRLISHVLINIIQNSVFALDKTMGKHITVISKTSQTGQFVLEVCDNGKGIPEDILDKVFIPFYTTREGGSGIGLSLARQIMSMHNGSIKVKSEPGIETVFTLVFN